MTSFLLAEADLSPPPPDGGILMVPPTPFFRFRSAKEKKEIKARMGFSKELSGTVVDGDWYLWTELRNGKKDQNKRASYLSQRIHHKKPLNKSKAYTYFMDIVKRRPGLDGLHSESDVYRRIEGLEQVIRYAEKHKTLLLQQDLDGSSREMDDIWVHVGADGRLISFIGGDHRLLIAQIMELPAIPVRLGYVHKRAVESGKWKEILANSEQLHRHSPSGVPSDVKIA